MKLPHLSFSSLNLWRNCPRAWYAKYVDKKEQVAGEAAKFGSAFDQAIAKSLGLVDKVEITYEGVESAIAFYNAQPWAWKKADEAQKQITITPGQWATMAEMFGAESEIATPIIGYIDLFRTQGIERQIVDLKTSSRAGFRIDWALQGLLYILATSAQVFEIHLLATAKKCPTAHRYVIHPDKDKLRWCMETLGTWANQIEAFEPGDTLMANPDYHCEWCPEKLTCTPYNLSKTPELV